MARIRHTRTLRDINLLGKTITIPDPDAESGKQVVWLQKLNPADQQIALRKANAARARHRAALRDPDSDQALNLADTYDKILDDVDQMIELILAEPRRQLIETIESRLELEELDGEPTEWGRDGYLQGLRDAWMARGRDLYHEDEDDPDARHMLDEFARFSEEVEAILTPQVEDMKTQWRELPIEQLRKEAQEKLGKTECEEAWVREFERAELYLATRKPCDDCKAGEDHRFVHDDIYFQGRDEIDTIDSRLLRLLLEEYHDLTTDVIEGKGSPGDPASSSSSASPESEETAPGSGQQDAVV